MSTAPMLVHQEGKLLESLYYIISIYDSVNTREIQIFAYELETTVVYTLTYTYTEFDKLFIYSTELMNPSNVEGRFNFILDHLAFVGKNGVKELVVSSNSSSGQLSNKDEKKENKQEQAISMSVSARKRFLSSLQEKAKLIQLKAQQRLLKIQEKGIDRLAKIAVQEKDQRNRVQIQKQLTMAKHESETNLQKKLLDRELAYVKALVAKKAFLKAQKEKRLAEAKTVKQRRDQDLLAKSKEEREKNELIAAKREAVDKERLGMKKLLAKKELQKKKGLEQEKIRRKQLVLGWKRRRLDDIRNRLKEKYQKRLEREMSWNMLEEKREKNEQLREKIRNEMELERVRKIKAIKHVKPEWVWKSRSVVNWFRPAVNKKDLQKKNRRQKQHQAVKHQQKTTTKEIESVKQSVTVPKEAPPALVPTTTAAEDDIKKTLMSDPSYRKQAEIEKIKKWKELQRRKIESLQAARMEAQRKKQDEIEMKIKGENAQREYLKELEEKRERLIKEREHLRNKKLLERIQVLPPTIGIIQL
jgi:hypothetical protein